MTIYVIYYQNYDDVWLMDAFRSREAAKKAVESYPDDSDYYCIEEVTLH